MSEAEHRPGPGRRRPARFTLNAERHVHGSPGCISAIEDLEIALEGEAHHVRGGNCVAARLDRQPMKWRQPVTDAFRVDRMWQMVKERGHIEPGPSSKPGCQKSRQVGPTRSPGREMRIQQ